MRLEELPLEILQEIAEQVSLLKENKTDAEYAWLDKPLPGQLQHSNDSLVIRTSFRSLSVCSRLFWNLCRPIDLHSFYFTGDQPDDKIEAAIELFGAECHLVKSVFADIIEDDMLPYSMEHFGEDRISLVCDFVDFCTTLETLILDVFGPPVVTQTILNKATTLVDLRLTTGIIYQHGCDGLASCLDKLPNLRNLSLHLSGAADESDIDQVRMGVGNLRNLKSFDLSGECDQIDFIGIAGLQWKSELHEISLSPVAGWMFDPVLRCLSERLASSLRKLTIGFSNEPKLKDSPEPVHLPCLKQLTLSSEAPPGIVKYFTRSPIQTLCFSDDTPPNCSVIRELYEGKHVTSLEHLDLGEVLAMRPCSRRVWVDFQENYKGKLKVTLPTSRAGSWS